MLRTWCTAAVEHAVWTAVVCGMLALFAFGQALPRLPLRVLDAPPPTWPAIAQEFQSRIAGGMRPFGPGQYVQTPIVTAPKISHPVDWSIVAACCYGVISLFFFAQFVTGLFLVRKLIATAQAACEFAGEAVYESSAVSVPVTVGFLRPRILLPVEWRDWNREKLDAVLTHEGAHVRRYDGLVTALAAVNRCVFWFHPLAWILERRLSLLAECACDDVCVATLGDSEGYASLLLEMVNAADASLGRLRYPALTMAAGSHIRQRIESLLIVPEGRTFSRGITRMGWAGVILCGIPLVVCAGAVELEHQQQLIRGLQRRLPVEMAQAQIPSGGIGARMREAEVFVPGMVFRCEDLRGVGLVLVPVTSPEYGPLLSEIQRRIENPAPEFADVRPIVWRVFVGTIDPTLHATSAILLNRTGKSIAALQLVWKYEEVGGRTYTRSNAARFGERILLPFSGRDGSKIDTYWNTILPGSKRYVGEDGIAGDNTDVRMPAANEMLRGGGGGGSAGGSRSTPNPIQSVTLTLDGVFFTDGEFVGPNLFGLWESITDEAKYKMDVAKAARDGKARGLAASAIMDDVVKIVGPVPDRLRPGLDARTDAARIRMQQEMRARQFQMQRNMNGDERTVEILAAQADTKLPNFRKR